MNDTYVTVVGNVVTKPERRRIESSGTTVVNFRIGSTSRRFDKNTGGWVDGHSFFVKVICWRSLADNVYQSLFRGDPVMVTGRLFTREYQAEDGTRRTSYELEATAVGHNLARGTSGFARTRAGQSTDTPDDDVDAGPRQGQDQDDDPQSDGDQSRDGQDEGEDGRPVSEDSERLPVDPVEKLDLDEEGESSELYPSVPMPGAAVGNA